MWPWEHLAVGYLCYSALSRVAFDRSPGSGEAIAVAIGSQLPDLVDKPLAWWLDVLPSGLTLGHSLFAAVPGSVVVFLIAIRARRPAIGVALAVGWLSHLPGDVLYPIALGGSARPGAVLWPLVPASPSPTAGLLENVVQYGDRYVAFLLSADGATYLLFEGALVGATLAVWLFDGAPGVPRANSRTGAVDEAGTE